MRQGSCPWSPGRPAPHCAPPAYAAGAVAPAAAAARPPPLLLLPPLLQTATLVVLNACLVGCILVCASLLLVPTGLPSELVPHIIGLLLLAAALAFSVNW